MRAHDVRDGQSCHPEHNSGSWALCTFCDDETGLDNRERDVLQIIRKKETELGLYRLSEFIKRELKGNKISTIIC